ncbi:hypothetical protein TIFTF001_032129 [Ficus carica]|uniref:Uncharacterized protein n=1 Tax=Ficus carica TaxID=3494 RepID=A0AA88DWD3_FICCA|nr:hypothetical protein TIFTF001_032129 [Ficus carica]
MACSCVENSNGGELFVELRSHSHAILVLSSPAFDSCRCKLVFLIISSRSSTLIGLDDGDATLIVKTVGCRHCCFHKDGVSYLSLGRLTKVRSFTMLIPVHIVDPDAVARRC